MLNKTAIKIIVGILFITMVGCAKEFIELDGPAFKKLWEDSDNHSAESWWYLGEKDSYHYIVRSRIRSGGKDILFYLIDSWAGDEYYYKIDNKYIAVVLDKPKEFTLDDDQWLNLKTRHIKFKNKLSMIVEKNYEFY